LDINPTRETAETAEMLIHKDMQRLYTSEGGTTTTTTIHVSSVPVVVVVRGGYVERSLGV
jgi:lipoate-protein ligase B